MHPPIASPYLLSRPSFDSALERGPRGDGATPLLRDPGVGPLATDGLPLTLRTGDGETRVIARLTRVGSAPNNDWVIADPHLSRHHAVLIPDGRRLRVTDQGSTNGTRVNGVPIETAELPFGACLTLGETRLRLCGAGPTALLGDSAAMARVREGIGRLAPLGRLAVLILGESGTGKELVARALHDGSKRRGDFVAVNCGALPRDLIESELFGHERGAFTGAQKRHLGCFGEAEGGTLFLDEIAELPLDLQPRLLRALESRCIRPVGSAKEVPVDVRVVAATHRDLLDAVEQGRFREDLYYRLFGAEVYLPPLRQRPEDVITLVRHFLHELAGEAPPCSISDEELARLSCHAWPGNVRELKNAVHRAAHLSGPRLLAADLIGERRRPEPRRDAEKNASSDCERVVVTGRKLDEILRDVYARALVKTGNNRRAAAESLGMPKSSFCDAANRLGLHAQAG